MMTAIVCYDDDDFIGMAANHDFHKSSVAVMYASCVSCIQSVMAYFMSCSVFALSAVVWNEVCNSA